MSSHTSFYPLSPLENLVVAPSSLPSSDGFSQEFINLPLLDNERTYEKLLLPYPPSDHRDQTPLAPYPMQTEKTRPRLRNRQLRPSPPTNRECPIHGEINQAAPFFQCPSFTDLPSSFNEDKHDHGHSFDQDFGFDEACSYPSDQGSSKPSPTDHNFWRCDIQRREKNLERNRVAASKSRQKKKREMDQLKTRFNDVSRKK
ncbi:hypothetical protein BJX68DRAFT_190667 [Aspergillus pseudodeflectus]|uniref:BZIP domain-containing protein n=1 Tax=Aspergillus pseudodeflectus TaxID=176178 RepID=A0ABR4JJU3_9EURO